jgi:hypothetical protein
MAAFKTSQADHLYIRRLLSMHGKVQHVRIEYDQIVSVFSTAGGSWERLFKGNCEDVTLLKRVVKVAVKKGHVTKQ